MQLHQAVFLSAGGMALVMLAVLTLLLPSRAPGIKDWLCANVVALFAYVFYGVGWDDAWRPGVEIANFLYACTAILVTSGYQRCAGLRPCYAVLLLLAGIMVSVLAYCHYVVDLPHLRVIAVSIFHFVTAFLILAAIRSTPQSPYVRRPLRLARILAALVVLTLVLRVVSRIPYIFDGSAQIPLGGNALIIVLLCLGALLLPGLTLAGAAVSVSKILQSASLEARTDTLTGLWNRRAFMGFVERELERSSRYGSPLALLMIDVDHFKRINDTFGHSMGDNVLIQVAQTCSASVRSIDFACRLGGEEFAVLLADTNADSALVVAERIRTKIAGASGDFRFTVSVGVSELSPDGSWSQLFEDADSALYRAKARGKNCCVVGEQRPATKLNHQ